jgi:hypothetical protein
MTIKARGTHLALPVRLRSEANIVMALLLCGPIPQLAE